jgi:phenylacetate-CoA ligase
MRVRWARSKIAAPFRLRLAQAQAAASAPHDTAWRHTMFDPWTTTLAGTDALWVGLAAPAAWQQRRAQRLRALLHHAVTHSAWWRQRLGPGAEERALAELPPSRRGELMAQFDGWVTEPGLALPALRDFARQGAATGQPYAGRCLVWESSGSSGEPALFVQDAAALAVADALEGARGPGRLPGRNGLPPLLMPGARLAFVGATDGAFATVVSLRRACRVNPWLQATLRAFSFLQPLAPLGAELQAWRPAVLASYPSMAWVLAQEQLAGRLALDLQAVWTGGETLTPACRAAIGRAFGCPVRNSYGASECLAIANECACGALHLNADWVILEPVDARLRPVPQGQAGHSVLLTHLGSRLQPIIRYDLGDRVRLTGQPCACGSPLPVIEVEGRRDDLLSLAGDAGRVVHLSPLALATVLEDEGGVFDFRLTQTGARALTLQLHGIDQVRDAQAGSALRAWLAAQGLARVRLRVQRAGAAAARGRSGKQHRVVSAAAPS